MEEAEARKSIPASRRLPSRHLKFPRWRDEKLHQHHSFNMMVFKTLCVKENCEHEAIWWNFSLCFTQIKLNKNTQNYYATTNNNNIKQQWKASKFIHHSGRCCAKAFSRPRRLNEDTKLNNKSKGWVEASFAVRLRNGNFNWVGKII